MARCCAEIGEPGSWRLCPRKAKFEAMYQNSVGYCLLQYCERHGDRLTFSRGTYIRVTNIGGVS